MSENFKIDIVNFINDLKSETYQVSDLFFNSKTDNGKLHHLGYKLLKDHYEFHTVDIEFNLTPNNQKLLTDSIDGLYYMQSGKKTVIYCTHIDSVNMLKLMSDTMR